MATLEERFQKGLEMRARLGEGEGRIFVGSVASAFALSPDMYRISTECLYGSIWNRPNLDIRHRVMATLTVAAVRCVEPQVRAYIVNALNVGLTPEEIVEVLMQGAFYGGIPAAYNALGVAKEIFEERGVQFTPSSTFDSSLDPEALYEKGVAKRAELIPDITAVYSMELTPEEHDMDLLMHEYLWGAIWTRPELDIKSRIICALSALVAQGQYDQFIRRMIEAGLRNGVTRAEIMETLLHLSFYVGMLSARSAMTIANSVFRSPEFSAPGSPGR